MDYAAYRKSYFVEPTPPERFAFDGLHGATLYFQDYESAIDFYQRVLGPASYVEGAHTKGWRIGNTWLTILRGKQGNPKNVEIQFVMESPREAERLQRALIEAGGSGPAPTDQLIYEPVRSCPLTDPFGTELLITSRLDTA